MQTTEKPPTLLRREAVKARTGLSTSGLYRLIQEGAFPRPVKVTDMGSVVAWVESEVTAFIEARIAERDAAAAGRGQGS
jgi:prophage regulatory protein